MNPKLVDIILKNLFKYSPLIVLSIALLLVGHLAKTYYTDSQSNKAKYQELLGQTQDYHQIKQDLAELQVEYVNDKQLRQQEEKDWGKERDYLKGQVIALGKTAFTIPSYSTTQNKPDLATKEFVLNELDLDKSGPPVGSIKISNTGEITKTFYKSEIINDFIVERTKDGRYHIFVKPSWVLRDSGSLATTNPELGFHSWLNQAWPLNITGGSLIINPTKDSIPAMKKDAQYATHFNFGSYAGAGYTFSYGLHADISFLGYGYTKNDLDWKIGAIGANFSRDHFDINVEPVKWRVGNVLPLVDDLYLGAGVGLSTSPGPTYFLTLDTTL